MRKLTELRTLHTIGHSSQHDNHSPARDPLPHSGQLTLDPSSVPGVAASTQQPQYNTRSQSLSQSEQFLSLSRLEISRLVSELQTSQSQSNYFESAVSTLYNRFTPKQEFDYLTNRLEGESLAPGVRVSVAIAREGAKVKWRETEKSESKNEVKRVVEMLKASEDTRGAEGVGGARRVEYGKGMESLVGTKES